MQAPRIDHMFNGINYTKSADEIKEKAKAKILKLKDKIEDRARRIAAVRKEHDIDDADLVTLLQLLRKNAGATTLTYQKMSNVPARQGMSDEKTIGAGVINNLLTEQDYMDQERDQVAMLDLMVRNLKPIPHYSTTTGEKLPGEEFHLNNEELKYLEF
jgi:hypothetical protein